FLAVSLELAQRAFLVGTHQSAVTSNVACKNRRKSSIDAVFGHLEAPAEITLSVRGISEGNNVRFGSKADIATPPTNVCFTPKSGHWNSVAKCPHCAKSGH